MCFIQLSKQVPLVKTTHKWQPDNTYNEGARTSSFCFYAWGVRVCASAYVDKIALKIAVIDIFFKN